MLKSTLFLEIRPSSYDCALILAPSRGKIPSDFYLSRYFESVDRVLVPLNRMVIGPLLFLTAFAARFHVPVQGRLCSDAKHFHTGPGIPVPAVDDFLPNPIPQMISVSSLNFQGIVARNAGVQIQIAGNEHGDNKIVRIGFADENSSAGIAVSLEKEMITLMSPPPGNTLQAEEGFILVIQAVQFLAVPLAILARLGVVGIADNTRNLRLSCRHISYSFKRDVYTTETRGKERQISNLDAL
jgi:hypothetical protein